MLRLHQRLHPVKFTGVDIFTRLSDVVVLDGRHLEDDLASQSSQLCPCRVRAEDSVSWMKDEILLSC